MSTQLKVTSVIIDNGSLYTRAGVSTDELPSMNFPSVYSENPETKEIVIGNEINDYPQNEIFTLHNDGLIYNFDLLEHNWKYIYKNLDLSLNESPLVVTENSWNTKKNRALMCELAFEKFEVPLFSLVKNSICTSYSYGRSTSIVIDIGSSIASITPIFNGIILNKGSLHTKFAGDFLNLHSLNFLTKYTKQTNEDFLVPSFYQGQKLSNSFKIYQINKQLTDFKLNCLQVSKLPISPIITREEQMQIPNQQRHYLLPNNVPELKDNVVELNYEQYQLSEPIFKPSLFEIPGVKIPSNSQGIIEMLLTSLQKLEVSTEVYSQLLSNVIITGGSSLLPNLEQRVYNEFQRTVPNLSITTYLNPKLFERNFSNWIGASILSSMGAELDNIYIDKKEYEEFGEDLIAERFK